MHFKACPRVFALGFVSIMFGEKTPEFSLFSFQEEVMLSMVSKFKIQS